MKDQVLKKQPYCAAVEENTCEYDAVKRNLPPRKIGKAVVSAVQALSGHDPCPQLFRVLPNCFCIQLFRQRLSHNSTKAHATIPTGILGSKSLALYLAEVHCV